MPFFWKSYFGNANRANLWDTVTPWDSVCLFLFFFTVGRNKLKIILLNMISYFWHTCLSIILVIMKNQTHPPPRMKFFQFSIFSKKCARGLERTSKFSFPKCFKQWSQNKGTYSLPTDYFEWNNGFWCTNVWYVCTILLLAYGMISFFFLISLLFTELSINSYFVLVIVQRLGATKMKAIACP